MELVDDLSGSQVEGIPKNEIVDMCLDSSFRWYLGKVVEDMKQALVSDSLSREV